ncbi:FCD domain-containing protein [Labrenzia sp. OB1]|uniref:FadR/GntR family transcriptional regulator n=1 Tax=Labrenzia sp. OB1 TaxID=1561204 RepID=UPI0007B2692E|nr:FCD domain-containing protein [Labrenzia sp. OB1]KZM47918.1 GntR family transcriptional regulator [Labrenzia sp. OB1]
MKHRKTSHALAELRNLLDGYAPEMGDRLPPERELARRLTCSRETLRNALSILEDENEVWRHVGQGTFRGPRPGAAPLRENLLVQATSVEEFVNARYLIEPVIAAEAARRASPSDIMRLNSCVAAGRNGRDRFECQKADDVFHRTIAEVAKNPILFSFLTFLSDARRRSAWQSQWDRTYRHLGIEEFTGQHSNQHQRIVASIEAGNDSAAETAMREHLTTIILALQTAPGSPKFSNFT